MAADDLKLENTPPSSSASLTRASHNEEHENEYEQDQSLVQVQRGRGDSDLHDVDHATATQSSSMLSTSARLHLNASSTNTSLTKTQYHDKDDNGDSEKKLASQTTSGVGGNDGDDEDDVDENPDADVDPHLASGHGKGGYGKHTERQKSQDGVTDEDVVVVDWDGPNDPCNPRNWSYKKKWMATAIVSAFTFMSPLSSSMIAPASDQLASRFSETNTVVIAMYTSIFVCAYAVGPLFLGPLSELYGRAVILQGSNLFYLVWNIACGFAQSTPELLIFRFLAGLGGSAPLSIGGGVLGDVWRTEERGKAIALYSLAPLLGPVVGPIAGAWIDQKSTWRWVFWSTSIANCVVQVLGFLFLRETFHPILLERKVERLQKEMRARGESKEAEKLRTPFQGGDRHWKHLFAKSIIRPFALFAREPIIQLLGAYMAFVYGILYLVLTTVPSIFQGPGSVYGEKAGTAGLNYIALGVGLTGASQVNARLLDKVYIWLSERERRAWERKHGGIEGGEKTSSRKRFGRPEFRLPSMFPGTIMLPAGLLMLGWGAEKHVHWIVPDIGIALIGAGMILNFQSIQTYVIDAFTLHAASALAAVSCFRSLAGFGFPLFAPAMYSKLGFGKGDTILAACAIIIGCPAPWLFWTYGERIRRASRYAQNE